MLSPSASASAPFVNSKLSSHRSFSKLQAFLASSSFAASETSSASMHSNELLKASPSVLHDLVDSVDFDGEEAHVHSIEAIEGSSVIATFDSAADVHVMTLQAANDLFSTQSASNLRLVGVTGSLKRADLKGHLVICVEDSLGIRHHIDCGIAHGVSTCPLNLLSVALLIKQGAICHFEKDNCYFQPHAAAERIPFQQNRGMFQLQVNRGSLVPEVMPTRSNHVYNVNGRSFATSGDIKLWHTRVRHMPPADLLRIFKHNLVDGFKLSGRMVASCDCDSCKQAKIRRQPTPSFRPVESSASFVGHTVSTDVKDLPFLSFRGEKYVINFVDHFSKLGFCYFMHSKNEVTAKLRQYVNDMARLGVKVRCVQSDRGSEYFAQEGESKFNHGRRLHEFDKYCESQNIRHIVTPVEMKEKIAENWFKDHFLAVDAMLWNARLSPAFWADAVQYSQYLFNRTPSHSLGGDISPWQLATGQRPRWDRFRVFGCDTYEHIPNNQFAKVPGVPKGRKLIFVGFQDDRQGFKVFDPETRRYHVAGNCYFYENFSSRIDALRSHDQRRQLLKKDLPQPIVIDDYDEANSEAVRNLFLDPDVSVPDASHRGADGAALDLRVTSIGGALPNRVAARGGAIPRTSAERATDESFPIQSHPVNSRGPLSVRSLDAERARQDIIRNVMLRPLRLLPVGKEQPYTPEDAAFIRYAEAVNAPISFLSPCPKSKGSGMRYKRYMHATTIRQAIELGATRDDIQWDYLRAFIKFPKHEPQISGHIFNAMEVANEHGHTHVLQDLGLYFRSSDESEVLLARAFNTRGQLSFNQVLETVFEPEVIVKELEERERSYRWAEQQAAKVFNSTSQFIDFAIKPEPTRFEEVMPEVCAEHERWREAMDDEITSMVKFGVFRRVPKSVSGGRQLLGCRWVFKRKTDKFGNVNRYRARLVALGYRQKPYDSFDPEETYSPVVSKDTLRLLLSVSAALNLRLYQADVKAAFLQAPLKERIYLRCPPGYSTVNAEGEEEVLELSSAIYGLKQSSNSFWTALHLHLVEKGFKSTLGDPCLLRRDIPGVGPLLVACYVDDLVYAAPTDAAASSFLAELRERFVIEEDQGKPIDFLLGMAVSQDIDAGTVSMNMEMAITKLARSILTEEEIVKSRGVHYPMLITPLIKLPERLVPKEKFDFLSVIGSLMYLSNCVRCDIATAVNILARHAATPGPQHINAAKRVLMYLYNTRSYSIIYRRSPDVNIPLVFESVPRDDEAPMKLQVFADSDYAMDYSRRSLMGTVIMLNGGPISWNSTLGKTVVMSTCEAEVSAAVVACKDAIHVKRLLIDLGLMSENTPIQIAEDNSACIAQAEAGLRHIRNAKHYQVRLRFLQDLVLSKEVEFRYTPTTEQLADLFTKPLEAETFVKFRNILLSPI